MGLESSNASATEFSSAAAATVGAVTAGAVAAGAVAEGEAPADHAALPAATAGGFMAEAKIVSLPSLILYIF